MSYQNFSGGPPVYQTPPKQSNAAVYIIVAVIGGVVLLICVGIVLVGVLAFRAQEEQRSIAERANKKVDARDFDGVLDKLLSPPPGSDNQANGLTMPPLETKDEKAANSSFYSLANQGRYEEALEAVDKGLQRFPNSALLNNNKAWLLATCPEEKFRDGKTAIELAKVACVQTNWENVAYLDTLAAAYAEAGDFQSAIEWQEKTIDVNGSDIFRNENLRPRLELYRAGKPYRQESKGTSTQPVGEIPDRIESPSGISLVFIYPGEFMMGGTLAIEKPIHKVYINKPFYMATTEVTQGQWEAIMGTAPWSNQGEFSKSGPENAASYISWSDAKKFCEKLSEKEGKKYRLPTEEEWEYACRAKTRTRYSYGDDPNILEEYAWFKIDPRDDSERYAHAVAHKKPNAFGLYDMHGNVAEWCQDKYRDSYDYQRPTTQTTNDFSNSRVVRGGSCMGYRDMCTSASRHPADQSKPKYFQGFRVVCEVD